MKTIRRKAFMSADDVIALSIDLRTSLMPDVVGPVSTMRYLDQ